MAINTHPALKATLNGFQEAFGATRRTKSQLNSLINTRAKMIEIRIQVDEQKYGGPGNPTTSGQHYRTNLGIFVNRVLLKL